MTSTAVRPSTTTTATSAFDFAAVKPVTGSSNLQITAAHIAATFEFRSASMTSLVKAGSDLQRLALGMNAKTDLVAAFESVLDKRLVRNLLILAAAETGHVDEFQLFGGWSTLASAGAKMQGQMSKAQARTLKAIIEEARTMAYHRQLELDQQKAVQRESLRKTSAARQRRLDEMSQKFRRDMADIAATEKKHSTTEVWVKGMPALIGWSAGIVLGVDAAFAAMAGLAAVVGAPALLGAVLAIPVALAIAPVASSLGAVLGGTIGTLTYAVGAKVVAGAKAVGRGVRRQVMALRRGTRSRELVLATA